MRSILLLALLGVAGFASPYVIDEFYERVIAVDVYGRPLNQPFRCPACRSWPDRDNAPIPVGWCTRCRHILNAAKPETCVARGGR